jgi:pilus assembly protein CpaF
MVSGGALTIENQERILEAVGLHLKDQSLDILRNRRRLRDLALAEITNTASHLGIAITPEITAYLATRAVALAGGLGFIDDLLPPNRDDLSEITLTPAGQLWIMTKGARDFEPLPYQPTLDETWRAVEALLAPIGRSVSEATPSVDAKLSRMAGMGGARVKIIHPRLAPGLGFPSINIRLFEPKPVTVDQLLAWQVAPERVLQGLLRLVGQGHRVLITGGTYTGKTTILSAIANGIPQEARVIKIEDPEEIWLDHPHVVTLEARPAFPGSTVPPYTIKDGVDDAMRMSPRWLIVGEVRKGDAAMALFRAQMSDHPGLSTFHATNPEHAIHRMSLIMFTDQDIRFQAAKETIAQAVDVIVQIGWLNERRQILGIWGVYDQLYGGDVKLEPYWLAPGYEPNQQEAVRKIEHMKTLLHSNPQADEETAALLRQEMAHE